MSYHAVTTKKSLNAGIQMLLKRGTHIGLGIGAFTPMLALANPTGGQVVAGTATIKNINANNTVVNQSSQSAIIDWQQFNIGKGQYVQFQQPSSSSIILNRVIGGGGSAIYGTLSGNGQVFLVNTNGVFFGKGASIDAQGFLASTLDIADSDFLSGNFLFDKSGTDAKVVNQGTITAHKGGYVVLAGDYAENDGLITAQAGHIVLAAGAKSTLTLNGNGLVSYAVDQATLANLAGAVNAGKLHADGGSVLLSADVANALKATVVNNTGLIEARTISKSGSTIQLLASGGNIENAGTLDASATRAGLQGGDITLKGDERTTLTDASRIIATGNGADGGRVEVSGNTIALRGSVKLGKGGNLLMDPASVELVSTGGTGELGGGTSATSPALSKIGVDEIQSILNSSGSVAISAHNLIFASSHVKSIKATGTGNLSLDAGYGAVTGNINLRGVDITIGGDFNAEMGYGGSFGHIQAKSVTMLAASPGAVVELASATKNSKGVVTANSVKATGGGIFINAANVAGTAESGGSLTLIDVGTGSLDGMDVTGKFDDGVKNVTLKAESVEVDGGASISGTFKASASVGYAQFGNDLIAAKGVILTDKGGSDITVNGTIAASDGAVTINAGNHTFYVLGGGHVSGNNGVSITANTLQFNGSSEATYSINGGEQGGITIHGRFAGPGSGTHFDNGLNLHAAKGISLDHSIFDANGSVTIEGASLTYTGAGAFSISANQGDLTLAAPIGAVGAPVAYTVNLSDHSGGIFLERSIFTAGSINATQTFGGASSHLQGVLVGNSSGVAMTLSAKKSINLSGANVGIGSVAEGHSSMGAITVAAGQNIVLTATPNTVISGSHSSHSHQSNGSVGIHAGDASGTQGNTAIVVKAGKALTIAGRGVSIRGGSASASVTTSGHAKVLSDNASVTLSAGTDMTITAGSELGIDGGRARAFGFAGKKGVVSETVNASVSLSAGGNMSLTGSSVQLSHGYGQVFGSANEAGAVVNQNVDVSLSLKAGQALSVTATDGNVGIGNNRSLSHVAMLVAAESGGHMTSRLNGDINLTAGTALSVSGREVHISAGYGLAARGGGPGEVNGGFSGEAAATAALVATANVNIKAGAGGVSLVGAGSSEAGVALNAAGQLGQFLNVLAGNGGKASADVTGDLTITTTGDLDIVGTAFIDVDGGNSNGAAARVIGYNKGVAKLTTHGDLAISAKDISMNSGASAHSTEIRVSGGTVPGIGNGSAEVGAFSGGSVAINNSGRVDLKAVHDITISGSSSVTVGAGVAPGVNAHAIADGGKLTIRNDSGLSLAAGGNISLFAGSAVKVNGGGGAGANHHSFQASYGGVLSVTDLARVDIKAGGKISAAASSVSFFGGGGAGSNGNMFASSHGKGVTKASLTVDSSLNVTAGSLAITAFDGEAGMGAGGHAGFGVADVAAGAKATATMNVNAGANFNIAGAATLDGSSIGLFAGSGAGGNAFVGGFSGGKAAYTVNAGISFKAGGAVTLTDHGGGSQSIIGARNAGRSDHLVGSGAGASANATINAGAVLTAGGVLTMTSAAKAKFIANSNAAQNAFASNDGGIKVTDTVNNAVTVSAKSMTISASDSVEVFAGAGIRFTDVIANGGAANLSVTAGVNFNAATNLSMKVTGSGGSSGTSRRLLLIGGNADGAMSVSARHGGKAAETVNAGVNVKAGGAITLKNTGSGATSTHTTGSGSTSHTVTNHASHGIYVFAGSRLGANSGHAATIDTGAGGGTATLTADASLNISTKGAFSMDAGSGQAAFGGGSSAADQARLFAGNAGKVSATLTQNASLAAASATINGGQVIVGAGGGNDARAAHVSASHAGIATLDAESVLRMNLTGALTVTGQEVGVTGGEASPSGSFGFGGVGMSAGVHASHGGVASLIAKSSALIKAGSVSLTANNGQMVVAPGVNDAAGASITAAGKGDKASMAVDGTVSISATTGGITLKTTGSNTSSSSFRGDLQISAGANAGSNAEVVTTGAGAVAGLTVDTSLNLSAKGLVSASAGSQLQMEAGFRLGAGELVLALAKGSKTTVSDTAAVNIAAANVSLKGAGVAIHGADHEGSSAFVGANHSGAAAVTENGTFNIKAVQGITIDGVSHVFVDAGSGVGFGSRTAISASHHGVATLNALAGVSLQAGGNVTISADGPSAEAFLVAGGNYEADVNAQEGGTATFTRDSSVNVKTAGSLTVKASFTPTSSASASAGRGTVLILGGSDNRLMSNTFGQGHPVGSEGEVGFNSHGGGKATGTLVSQVNLTAGVDATLSGGSTMAVVAGEGNQLFVGAARIHGGFSGQRWNGGQATLSLNTNVNVTAGRDLHLAGSSIQVLGMAFGGGSFSNQANVMGGSSSAVASLTLTGNASLKAARDITIAGGSASVVGGSLGNLRADHASGHVTILGSADASLKAGRDVSLNLEGNLTVAGVNVNSSHAGFILVDAHADQGFASVTGHADANITAGRNITNGSASLGGLNVVGGQFVDAVAKGVASNQKATATANAGLSAGGAITLNGAGDLTVGGGLFDSAAVSANASVGSSANGQRAASLQARASIVANGTVSLTFNGDGVIAGGDSLTAKAALSGDRFLTGTVTADTGVLIKGASVNLSVDGNLLVRGGSGANATALGIGTDVKATATGSADAVISAVGTTKTTGNLTINVGSGSSGVASFVGGSAGKASVQVFGSGDAATGTAHDDVSLTATKAINLTVGGELKVAGGPGAENSALVLAGLPSGILTSFAIGAASGTAKATVTGKVGFSAGTTLTVHAGGDVNILGGSRGGDGAIVAVDGGSSGTNGKHDTASLSVDTSVSLSAKGAVAITADGGTGSVHVTTFASGSTHASPTLVANSSSAALNHNVASANINETVKITGKTVTLTLDPHGDFKSSSGGLVIDGTITVTGHPIVGFHPQGGAPHSLHLSAQSLQVQPLGGTTSFGGLRQLGGADVTTPAAPTAPTASVSGDGAQLLAPSDAGLDTLQVQGLVVNLQTVMSGGQSQPEQGTLFTPPAIAVSTGASFPSSCNALLLKADAGYRCAGGTR